MSNELLERARAAESRGEWDLAVAFYEEATPGTLAAGDIAGYADILRWIGRAYREKGELDVSEEIHEVSLAVADRAGLRPQVASALIGLAALSQMRGRLAEAYECTARAREICDAIGDLRLAAATDNNLGTLANIRGDVEVALRHYAAALERARLLGDTVTQVRVLNNIGMAHVDLAEWRDAQDSFDLAFQLADELRDPTLLGAVEINRAELFVKQGDRSRARDCCDSAFEIFGRMGSESGLAEVYKHYGIVYREAGKPVLADTHFASAVQLARKCQDRLLEAEALNEWAMAHLGEERNREALRCLNDAHRLFAELHARRDLLDLDRRLDSLEGTYLRVVRAWGESIESKDRYTAGHCERVANYACMLAEAVGITGRDLTWLRMGGYLHDVGKIAIPPEVLNKPGKLDEHEWKLMQSHTTEGDAIVAELNFPWDIRPVVRSHHERWDGSGYPDGLKGEEIPLYARILCVADVYDALTTTRSYRPALSQAEALGIMERDAGRIFDPDLYALFRARITSALAPTGDLRFPVFGAAA